MSRLWPVETPMLSSTPHAPSRPPMTPSLSDISHDYLLSDYMDDSSGIRVFENDEVVGIVELDQIIVHSPIDPAHSKCENETLHIDKKGALIN